MKNRIDSEFLEKLIIKSMMVNKKILTLVCSVFEPEYFDDPSVKYVFKYYKKHLNEFHQIAPPESVINSTKDKINIKELFNEVNSIDYNIAENQDHLLTEINFYLKDKALKMAMVDGVNIIDKGGDVNLLRDKIEKALCKDIKIDLGLEYFKDLGSRLKRIFTATDYRLPSYFPQFDEYINGGFPPFTLSVLVAKIHGWKSQLQANFAARQVLNGHNIVLLTLEMSENEFAQRFDAIYSNLDINRIYISEKHKSKLVMSLKEIRDQKNRGNLFIKQFPTGNASVNDFKIYLRELIIRGIKLSAIYVDYINLMKPAYKVSNDLYSSVKRITEELRALSFEFEIPVISVSQLNREGSFVGFEQIDFNYIAECLDLNTKVIKNGNYVKIKDLKIGDKIKGSNGDVEVKNVWPKKYKKRYRIKTKLGKEIICSYDHKFPTGNGVKSLKTGLKIGNKLKTINYNYFDEIIEIEELDDAEMIDIEVSGDHFFYANDILTKNSIGLAATADFMTILGTDEDAIVYQNEIWYKIVKNRLGGRVGESDKFYYDGKSLKIYDATELDLWMSEKEISGDERKIFEKVRRESANNSRRNR